MKRLFTILITSSLFAGFGYAQTESEKEKIINSYDRAKINALKESISNNEQDRSDRITNFLNSNPDITLKSTINGKLYQIFDILDNEPVYRTTENIASAAATRTNFLHNGGGLGLNLEGQNMIIGVWDGNHTLPTHVEFGNDDIISISKVTTPDFEVGSSYANHATHVSGTLVARGIDPDAKGMAPQAALVSYQWDNDANEALSEASNNALLISNHSYGVPVLTQSGAQNAPTWLMGCYNSDARQWDEIAYNNPYYLQVASAGNSGQSVYAGGLLDGYDKLTTEKNSKNNLVVANAANPDVSGAGDLLDLQINPSSSQGPTDDGRIKPDITGDGTSVYSSISSGGDQAYGIATGTSMSSPNVAGSLLLLQQYYNELNSQYMKAATLKGLVCHTADDDSQRIGPDPIYGWGLLNAKAAAETIQDSNNGTAIIDELNLALGETYSRTFATSGNGPISVTICWTDPPGIDQSGITNSPTPALVNDLDIILRAPDGVQIYFPWKLRLFDITGSAVTGDNTVDTVEKIDVAVPAAGTYTIEVSHKGFLTGSSQDFSLIVSGTDVTLGVGENSLDDFAIWPNPANNILNYNFISANSSNVSITLLDVQGRVVFSDLLDGNKQLINGSINTQSFTNGIYFLRIKQGNAISTKKVIIR